MTANAPTVEPLYFQAGDTLYFLKSIDGYTPTGDPPWTLNYYAVNAGGKFSFAAAASGSSFEIHIPPATTASWTPGTYELVGEVTNPAGDRFTVYSGEITVTPNIAAVSTSLDYRSWAQKALAIVEGVISGRLALSEVSYSINGRSISKMTHAELFAARDYLKSCIAQEKAEIAGKNRRVLTRFVRS